MSLLEEVVRFQAEFDYNNWVCCFAGVVLEEIIGEFFGSSIQREIVHPLGLSRMTIELVAQKKPLADIYQTLDNETSWRVPRAKTHDTTIMRPAGGAKSSVNNLNHYSAFLAAAKHQLENGCTSTPGLPFRQVSELVCDQILISFSNP